MTGITLGLDCIDNGRDNRRTPQDSAAFNTAIVAKVGDKGNDRAAPQIGVINAPHVHWVATKRARHIWICTSNVIAHHAWPGRVFGIDTVSELSGALGAFWPTSTRIVNCVLHGTGAMKAIVSAL